jgi:hypothetical protein
MNTCSRAPTVAAIVRPPGEGERFERANRVVTIKVDLPDSSIHEIEFEPTFEYRRTPTTTLTRCSSSTAKSSSSAICAVAELAPEPSSLPLPGPSTGSATQVQGARGS